MVSETKWTPGPWKACHNGDCPCGNVWSIPGDVPVFRALNDSPEVLGFVHNEWGDAPDMIYGAVGKDAQKANARLIAAAPDLYEALEKLSNEVLALRAFEAEVRAAISNTNFAVLIQRAEEARAALLSARGEA